MNAIKALKGKVTRRVLIVGGAAAVSAASLGGISYALTSNSSPTTPYQLQSSNTGATANAASAASNALGKRGLKVREFLRQTVHATFVVKDRAGNYVTVDADRGTVTSSSSSSITIQRPDGVSVTESIGSRTHQPKAGRPADGQQVVVLSYNGTALRIFDLRAAASSSSGSAHSS